VTCYKQANDERVFITVARRQSDADYRRVFQHVRTYLLEYLYSQTHVSPSKLIYEDRLNLTSRSLNFGAHVDMWLPSRQRYALLI